MRNLLRVVAVVAGVVCVVALFAFVATRGGGGGDDERAATPAGPSAWAAVISSATAWACPSASPTVTDTSPNWAVAIPLASPTPSAAEVLLAAASLRPEDLPDHFAPGYERFTTNEQLIAVMGQLFEEPSSLSVTREELDCWGRILGYTWNYHTLEGTGPPFSGTAGFQVAVDLFRDSGGAGQYFAWLGRDLSNPPNSATWKRAQQGYDGFEWRDVRGWPISFPSIGDERIAGEMAAALHYPYDPDLDFEYAAKTVAFRSGRAVGTIAVYAKDSVPRTKELEDLARTLDERIKDALTGTTTAEPTASATPTPSPPTMTPEERAEAEALLRAAALRPEDIPEGFPLEDEAFTTNEDFAEAGELWVEMFGSAAGAAPDPYSVGRILGYDADYDAEAAEDLSSFSGTASFGVSVDLFQDSAGAHEVFELARQVLSRPEDMEESQGWQELREYYERFGLEVTDFSASSLSFPEVGDERVALEMGGTMRLHLPDLDADFHAIQQFVGFRRGRATGAVSLLAVNSAPRVGELEDLARKMDERMQDALE